jgi:hypothetical protein
MMMFLKPKVLLNIPQKLSTLNYKTLYKEKCIEVEKQSKRILELEYQIQQLTKELRHHTLEKPTQNARGKMCSVSGGQYEKQIHNIVKHCTINGKPFNTQNEDHLGGSSAMNDIECITPQQTVIGIEIKKCKTPDWMQCSVRYNNNTKQWEGSKNCKIPEESKAIFDKLIKDLNLFNGKVPLFMEKPVTHEEWLQIKSETNDWDDHYIDVPNDTIKRVYAAKNCYYIQISDYGLYHLGNDICGFNVPEFSIAQRLRVRTKVHAKQNAKGMCALSVMVACQPKDIKSLPKSQYSLDSKDRLPPNLVYS